MGIGALGIAIIMFPPYLLFYFYVVLTVFDTFEPYDLITFGLQISIFYIPSSPHLYGFALLFFLSFFLMSNSVVDKTELLSESKLPLCKQLRESTNT